MSEGDQNRGLRSHSLHRYQAAAAGDHGRAVGWPITRRQPQSRKCRPSAFTALDHQGIARCREVRVLIDHMANQQ